MVKGFWSTLLVGMLGAFFSEAIRIGKALRQRKPPVGVEWLASVIFVGLGAGVILFGWDDKESLWKVAVLGAAFPALFSSAVDTATVPAPDATPTPTPSPSPTPPVPTPTPTERFWISQRSLVDYLASRF